MKTIPFEGSNATLAGETPVYQNNQLVTTCWELSAEEVYKVLENKKIYLTINTGKSGNYQPSLLHVDSPLVVSKNG